MEINKSRKRESKTSLSKSFAVIFEIEL